MGSLNDLVPVPRSMDINSGVSPCHQETMLDIFGRPGALSRNCSDVTAPALRDKIVTRDVGPFKVTGHSAAVASLTDIFAVVKSKRPDLYDAVGYDGMLCCRAVRGSTHSFSNHSWGFAIDMHFGALDDYGATMCHRGLLEIYTYFHQARWYWGAGFPKCDPMHFEPCDELVREWHAQGKLV